jgi:DNA-binding transcriptional regulator YiaG
MTDKHRGKMRRSGGHERPFPWRCPNCGEKQVYRCPHPYEAEVKHDGRVYIVPVPDLQAPKCRACGEVLFDDQADEQVNAALRLAIGLLAPDEIRCEAKRLGVNQRDLAKGLGIAEETLSRWLNGAQIQSKALDKAMRRYFEVQLGVQQTCMSMAAQTDSDPVLDWQGMFPNVAHIREVFEYSLSVASRGQVLVLGVE